MEGWVAPDLAAEFPGLGIQWVEVESSPGRSPEPVRQRLRGLADRFYGAQAVHLRERPIPWAYRTFFRQIGLDPDRTRTPVEQLALDRLRHGGYESHGLPADALTIATVETGVALRAFDAERLQGALGLRTAGPGESLPGKAAVLPGGALVIADERAPVGVLFGATGEGLEVESGTRRIAIVAIRVEGVPQIAVEEALWTIETTLGPG